MDCLGWMFMEKDLPCSTELSVAYSVCNMMFTRMCSWGVECGVVIDASCLIGIPMRIEAAGLRRTDSQITIRYFTGRNSQQSK